MTINGMFETWAKKDSVIGEEFSKTFDYHRVYPTLDRVANNYSVDIFAYDGEGDPYWSKDESGHLLPNFRLACTLKADLLGLRKFLKVQKTSAGHDFWRVDYKVKVFFGGTALKARLTWEEGVSSSLFHPHVPDIWLCPSENPARRPCQHYSELSLLDRVSFPA